MGSNISAITSKVPFFRKKEKKREVFRVIPRAEWKARVPHWREDLIYPALSVKTVYTGTRTCSSKDECTGVVQEIQVSHMDQDKLPDIEYSFLVGGDGSVFEGRGWHTISNRNTTIRCVDPEFPPRSTVLRVDEQKSSPDRCVVIAMIGDEKNQEATELMKKAVSDLVKFGMKNYYLDTGDDRSPYHEIDTLDENEKDK